MYLCNNNKLRRYQLKPDGTLSKGGEILINDMLSGSPHPNRTMDLGRMACYMFQSEVCATIAKNQIKKLLPSCR